MATTARPLTYKLVQIHSLEQLPRWTHLPAGILTLQKVIERFWEEFEREPVVYVMGNQHWIEMPERIR